MVLFTGKQFRVSKRLTKPKMSAEVFLALLSTLE
jgi:hypothetical protein